jgi:hypothetical protein
MKTLINTFMVSILALLSSVAYAQTEPIWRNDPTYSTHNYKHPNKAAAAQRRALEPGVSVRFPQPGVVQAANYKMPQPGQVPAGSVVLPHTPSNDLADRNYKMPRPVRVEQPKLNVADKLTPTNAITTD